MMFRVYSLQRLRWRILAGLQRLLLTDQQRRENKAFVLQAPGCGQSGLQSLQHQGRRQRRHAGGDEPLPQIAVVLE